MVVGGGLRWKETPGRCARRSDVPYDAGAEDAIVRSCRFVPPCGAATVAGGGGGGSSTDRGDDGEEVPVGSTNSGVGGTSLVRGRNGAFLEGLRGPFRDARLPLPSILVVFLGFVCTSHLAVTGDDDSLRGRSFMANKRSRRLGLSP